ncbi:hypothetical protein QBC41DRAFT_54841 [Cercophora samala]|uniref:Nephrocystin 3-like N-terminal domain-containing protein n=1 Tax=Cercophora samala TaxID=330535 RepID=A0AA39ZIA3_9PEZI|nr:hypothetical protein QBC41DRAFT_54841 [Cercophora samala]
MDPISAFSLTVNVLSTVDIAVRTGKTLWELYKSTSGFTKQTDDLRAAIGQFDAALGELSTPALGLNTSTNAAAQQCSQTIRDIRAIIDSCKARKQSSVISAVKAKLEATKQKSKLQNLQEQLERMSTQLRFLLAIATKNDITRMKQLLEASDVQLTGLTPKLDAIIQEITKLDGNSEMLQMIKEAMCLSRESLEAMNQAAILRALQPATADKRFDEVSDPAGDTFRWILQDDRDDDSVFCSSSSSEDSDNALSASDDSESDDSEYAYHGPYDLSAQDPQRQQVSNEFIEWLKTGSGVFHIAGKPGAGKSTLMKLLATHSATREHLESWAGQGAPKKQLIFSRFFFWRLGSAEQKTMRGLLRGIVYDVLRETPSITNLLFPEHWAPKRYAVLSAAHSPLQKLSDAEVKTAFGRLLTTQEILDRFKICLFIDGLDEFEEPTQSLWAFCTELGNWAKCDNVKLCVSSREETPILEALSFAHRITLQTLTAVDVEKLIRSRLDRNDLFQRFTDVEKSRVRELIVANAAGVFLWVVLLLKLIEEELAQQVASFWTLDRLIKTTPLDLDEFFKRIFQTIPKHHRRGAYFVFAALLRHQGYCVAEDYSWRLFYIGASDRDLSLIGLSYILDSFADCGSGDRFTPLNFPIPPCADESEVSERESQTTSRLQRWCRGLVETRERDSIQVALFTHRSVSDFLCGELQKFAPEWCIDDNWIAEGILTACLAEWKSFKARRTLPPNVVRRLLNGVEERLGTTMSCIGRTTTFIPDPPASRIFALLEEIDTARQSWWYSNGNHDVNNPTFYLQNKSIVGFRRQRGPVFHMALLERGGLVCYVIWKLERTDFLKNYHTKLLALASAASSMSQSLSYGVFLSDISMVLRSIFECGVSPNTPYPQYPTREQQCFTTKEWDDYLRYNRKDFVIRAKSPWRVTLSLLIVAIAMSDKGGLLESRWNELETWLQAGAEVPAEVLIIPVTQNHIAVGLKYPQEKAEIVVYSLSPSFRSTYQLLSRSLQHFRSTTLSSLVRWHRPHNMATLLQYTDQVGVLAGDSQEWPPQSLTTSTTSELEVGDVDCRLSESLREHIYVPSYGGNPRMGFWVYNLSWDKSLRQWVCDGPRPHWDEDLRKWVLKECEHGASESESCT